ncbi:MAG: hypothetical protein ACR5KV_05380 [Wolbachia sp.]
MILLYVQLFYCQEMVYVLSATSYNYVSHIFNAYGIIKANYVTNHPELSEFLDSYQNELKTEIVDGITLRDILTNKHSRLVSYVRNKDVQEILASDGYQSRFPICGSAVKVNIRKK